MKKVFLALLMSLFLFSGSAMAYSITYMDNTINWPGYNVYPYDEIGTPKISSLTVVINDNTNFLEEVWVTMEGRRVWDSLFINVNALGESYEAWDYYVYDDNLDDTGATLYTVGSTYQYIYDSDHRPGHPAGIVLSSVTPDTNNLLNSVLWNGTDLVYVFNPGIELGSKFVIGYSPWCANDVILTPEPSALIMLGLGLVGVVAMRRRKR